MDFANVGDTTLQQLLTYKQRSSKRKYTFAISIRSGSAKPTWPELCRQDNFRWFHIIAQVAYVSVAPVTLGKLAAMRDS